MVSLVAVGDMEFTGGSFFGRYEKIGQEKLGPELVNARLVDKISQYAGAHDSKLMLDWLKDADITFGNLETSLAKSRAYYPPRPSYYRFRADPSNAEDLKLLGFDTLCLANNHVFGYGEEGFIDTVEALDSVGIKHFGAGMNLEEALSPAIIEVKGQRIAFLGFSTIFGRSVAAEDRAGIAAIRNKIIYEYESPRIPTHYTPSYAVLPDITEIPFEEDIHMIKDCIEGLKDKADFVVISMHWGPQGIDKTPTYNQSVLGHAIIDAGADLVIGHHPHTAQSVEIYKGKYIFYSLGNFFMWLECDIARFKMRDYMAFMLKVDIENKKALRVELLPTMTDETGIPMICEDYEDVFKILKEVSSPLNASVVPHKRGAIIEPITK